MSERSPLLHQPPETVPRAEQSYPSRPIQEVKVIGGENYLGPLDPAGRLEKEIYLIQQRSEALQHKPGSYMDQRFQMAVGVRQNALGALTDHGGDIKQTIKSLKDERRQAVKAHDHKRAEVVDLEIGALKRAKGYSDPDSAVRLLEKSRSIDPEFGERGFLRYMGRSAFKSVTGDSLSGHMPELTFEQSLGAAMRPKWGREMAKGKRAEKLRTIQDRSLEMLMRMPAAAEEVYPSTPMRIENGVNGKASLVPRNATGRLAREIHLLQKKARQEQYEPGSIGAERLETAILARQNAMSSLEIYAGNSHEAIKGLETKKRQAIKEGDSEAVRAADYEITLLQRVSPNSYYDSNVARTIKKIERGKSRGPESGEKGLLRSLGRKAVKAPLHEVKAAVSSRVPQKHRAAPTSAAQNIK